MCSTLKERSVWEGKGESGGGGRNGRRWSLGRSGREWETRWEGVEEWGRGRGDTGGGGVGSNERQWEGRARVKPFQWFGWEERPGKGNGGRNQSPVHPATVSAEELTLLSVSRNPSLMDEDTAVFKVQHDRAGAQAELPMSPFFLQH